MIEKKRPEWDAYFLMVALVASTRSTCQRRHVGAVIVRDRYIVSTGYNGAPQGAEHCSEIGCMRKKLAIPSGERHEICRGSHAELNAIAQAAKIGVSTEDSTILSTHEPCSFCVKAILNAGIKEIVFLYPYPDKLAREMTAESKITVRQLEESALEAVRGYLKEISV